MRGADGAHDVIARKLHVPRLQPFLQAGFGVLGRRRERGGDGDIGKQAPHKLHGGVVPAVLYDRRLRRSGGMTFTIVRVF